MQRPPTTLQLDESTIYQIFYQYHRDESMADIAQELGICRQTVSTHLSWQRYHLYSERLRKRIAGFKKPKKSRSCPKGYFALEEASYFFPHRPTPRELASYCATGVLQSVRHYRQPVTKREWVMKAVGKLNLEGAFLTDSAVHTLQTRQPVSFSTIKFRARHFHIASLLTNEIAIPSRAITRAVSIQRFTGLPYVVLTHQDLT
jgi:hypothetical protein